ncbi:hypothetical protein CDAR_525091 [Caerostris darwini]|uniref:Uncharacterized protein n=1 Tax=Caerostris darwini TaxID=1538125 RepID=A0AAV4QYN4_9ARAC|nr:hypothetical protein CDAR_525091 [Caerostris darwini]
MEGGEDRCPEKERAPAPTHPPSPGSSGTRQTTLHTLGCPPAADAPPPSRLQPALEEERTIKKKNTLEELFYFMEVVCSHIANRLKCPIKFENRLLPFSIRFFIIIIFFYGFSCSVRVRFMGVVKSSPAFGLQAHETLFCAFLSFV